MIFCNEPNKRVALDCKEFVKYLGIPIDNHLSWKHHIPHKIKISQTIELTPNLRYFVPRNAL